LAGVEMDDIQTRQGHWAVVDLIGKGGHIRTVPIPQWAKDALDDWILAAGITRGRLLGTSYVIGNRWAAEQTA